VPLRGTGTGTSSSYHGEDGSRPLGLPPSAHPYSTLYPQHNLNPKLTNPNPNPKSNPLIFYPSTHTIAMSRLPYQGWKNTRFLARCTNAKHGIAIASFACRPSVLSPSVCPSVCMLVSVMSVLNQ